MARRPRLTTPLVRVDDRLRTATWDEAMRRAAAGMQAVIDRHGPTATGMFSCSKATNETNAVAAQNRNMC